MNWITFNQLAGKRITLNDTVTFTNGKEALKHHYHTNYLQVEGTGNDAIFHRLGIRCPEAFCEYYYGSGSCSYGQFPETGFRDRQLRNSAITRLTLGLFKLIERKEFLTWQEIGRLYPRMAWVPVTSDPETVMLGGDETRRRYTYGETPWMDMYSKLAFGMEAQETEAPSASVPQGPQAVGEQPLDFYIPVRRTTPRMRIYSEMSAGIEF